MSPNLTREKMIACIKVVLNVFLFTSDKENFARTSLCDLFIGITMYEIGFFMFAVNNVAGRKMLEEIVIIRDIVIGMKSPTKERGKRPQTQRDVFVGDWHSGETSDETSEKQNRDGDRTTIAPRLYSCLFQISCVL
ncbi:hypothetical protein NPIL_627321 [Nephila pilipes]|uniref:Uncharacterized protein n=1 Tax=Nephila pilipes TaxID=299642 RepID=A0A8X6N5R9_NEPPI|nr:hypothetical protein NPIL_627321 [Nephila pilipes]